MREMYGGDLRHFDAAIRAVTRESARKATRVADQIRPDALPDEPPRVGEGVASVLNLQLFDRAASPQGRQYRDNSFVLGVP